MCPTTCHPRDKTLPAKSKNFQRKRLEIFFFNDKKNNQSISLFGAWIVKVKCRVVEGEDSRAGADFVNDTYVAMQ